MGDAEAVDPAVEVPADEAVEVKPGEKEPEGFGRSAG